MQEGEVIIGFLFPADKWPSKAVDPRVGSLNGAFVASTKGLSMLQKWSEMVMRRSCHKYPLPIVILGSTTFANTNIFYLQISYFWSFTTGRRIFAR